VEGALEGVREVLPGHTSIEKRHAENQFTIENAVGGCFVAPWVARTVAATDSSRPLRAAQPAAGGSCSRA
jgi:hypothetical protein